MFNNYEKWFDLATKTDKELIEQNMNASTLFKLVIGVQLHEAETALAEWIRTWHTFH